MAKHKIGHIHFIGIGGIGISGLARLYVHEGWQVSGTNDNPSPQTLDALREAGVEISLDQTVLPKADVYVYSDAWLTLNPELLERARATGVPTMSYFEAIAEVANEYYVIAVAGTHGKTTTTAMLIDVLEEASFDPSAIVGSLRTKTGSNYRAGKSKYFVVEACEWRRHFHHFNPDVLVITNLEHEHVDYFTDLQDVQDAFRTLAQKVPAEGAVIAATKDPAILPVVKDLTVTVINYHEALDLEFELPQPGLYNKLNAAAARSAAEFLGIEKKYIDEALGSFAGTKRRFEYKGDSSNAPVYDDYAHHPTEIEAALGAAREKYPERKVVAVFQPHTYSRTKELQTQFIAALAKADEVILTPIYAARETDDGTISSELLVVQLIEQGIVATHKHTLEAAAEATKEAADKNAVIMVMGAGDITKVSDLLTN